METKLDNLTELDSYEQWRVDYDKERKIQLVRACKELKASINATEDCLKVLKQDYNQLITLI